MEVGDDARAVLIEAETQRFEATLRERVPDPAFVGGARVEHEEAAAARAHQLAADGPCAASRVVVLVDDAVGHVRGELALVGPVLVE